MDEKEFETWLRDAIFGADDVIELQTFEEACLLTNNRGLVVKLQSGEEFQVTIVRSY